jgi:hypothetical protein
VRDLGNARNGGFQWLFSREVKNFHFREKVKTSLKGRVFRGPWFSRGHSGNGAVLGRGLVRGLRIVVEKKVEHTMRNFLTWSGGQQD